MAAVPPPAQQVPVIPVAPPHVFLEGIDVVGDVITEADSLRQILHWIGFTIYEQKVALVNDAFGSYEDLKVLNEKDITAMSSDFSHRTANNGRI